MDRPQTIAQASEALFVRSLLFTPADDAKKIAKSLSSTADLVILDLEDAVGVASKDAARRQVCEVLGQHDRRPLAVRINAADSSFYLHDVAAIGGLGVEVIMLPKAQGGRDVSRLCDQLSVMEAAAGGRIGSTAILPLVTETAASLGALDYRGASPRLCALGFAAEDLASDLGIEARGADGLNPLLQDARRKVVVAAAAAGVPAVDTPFPDPRDPDGLVREVTEAARLGFTGKMCIHPGQIDAVNQAFCPDGRRVDWARAVVAALSGGGVAVVDGKMVDRAHLRLAERTLRLAGRQVTA